MDDLNLSILRNRLYVQPLAVMVHQTGIPRDRILFLREYPDLVTLAELIKLKDFGYIEITIR